LAEALSLCYEAMEEHRVHIQTLKDVLRKGVLEVFPDAKVNGAIKAEESLYTVLNISLPLPEQKEMLLFSLDIAGIAVSGGSACSSGSNVGSHVLKAIHAPSEWPAVRFSFSKMNTLKEVEFAIQTLKNLALVKV
jgi:cysteine desulfurase